MTRLTEEINKLILKTLSKDGGVYLPEVGSITIKEKRGALTLKYSTEESHKSLTTIIEELGKCSDTQAKQLYEKWLNEVSQYGMVTIAGVGSIKDGALIVSTEMLSRLGEKSSSQALTNEQSEAKQPQKSETKTETKTETKVETKTETKVEAKEIKRGETKAKERSVEEKKSVNRGVNPERSHRKPKRRKGRGYLEGLAVIVVVMIAVVSIIMIQGISDEPDYNMAQTNNAIEATTISNKEVETPIVAEAEATETKAEAKVTEATEAETTEVESAKASTSTKKRTNKIESKAQFAGQEEASQALDECFGRSTEPKRFRVVCGVLKYRTNAGRLIIDLNNRASEGVVSGVYVRNGNFMVTMFESNNIDECKNFMQKSVAKLYDKVWIFDDKAL